MPNTSPDLLFFLILFSALKAFYFMFVEGSPDNNRYKELRFNVQESVLLHGFAGYFECVLYDDVTLSKYDGEKAWLRMVEVSVMSGFSGT